MLQSLLLRLPRLQERVANAVTFPARYRGSHSSDPVGNGEGRPGNRDVRPWDRDASVEPRARSSKHTEASLFIEALQPNAGAWLDIFLTARA